MKQTLVLLLGLGILGGCNIYLDDREESGSSDLCCDEWGCYSCYGDYYCASNYDCEAGYYCDTFSGACVSSGWCSPDTASLDCLYGETCDDRDTCVPGDGVACGADSECPQGSYCEEFYGYCVSSPTCFDQDCGEGWTCDMERNVCTPIGCTSDEQCLEGCFCDEENNQCVESGTCDYSCGDGFVCDEARNTCEPEVTPVDPGTCQGTIVCTAEPPVCEEGTYPGIVQGCYSGLCIAAADCPDGAPLTCEDFDNDEDGCLAEANCSAIYNGVNCTDPNGDACTSQQANCTCEKFVFGHCDEVQL